MCVGHTLGEEVLFGPAGEVRTESVVAKENSCVLQVNIQVFAQLKYERLPGAGKDTLEKDYLVLLYILENHFVQKNEWREGIGIINDQLEGEIFPIQKKEESMYESFGDTIAQQMNSSRVIKPNQSPKKTSGSFFY